MPRSPRLILIGTILGSGAVFLEGFVTMVALPAIARDFHLGIAGLQWVLNGYLLTLSALILLGGALGDRFSRRVVFALGLAGFSVASIGCALAPNLTLLVVARVLQGAAGVLAAMVAGVLLLVAFVAVERRATSPLVPLDVFRVRQFTGVNATTLVVYAGLNGLFFLLMLELQTTMHYSALRAGASLLPMNALMLLLSPIAGRAAARVRPRVLMVGGSLIAAVGMLLFTRVKPG